MVSGPASVIASRCSSMTGARAGAGAGWRPRLRTARRGCRSSRERSAADLRLKVAINLSLQVQMVAFSEGLLLAEKGGIDRKVAVDADAELGDRVVRVYRPATEKALVTELFLWARCRGTRPSSGNRVSKAVSLELLGVGARPSPGGCAGYASYRTSKEAATADGLKRAHDFSSTAGASRGRLETRGRLATGKGLSWSCRLWLLLLSWVS